MSNWDKYFFNLATEVAKNSKCLSRQIGAVLVRENSIISTGYNGPARGVPSCEKRFVLDNYVNDLCVASKKKIELDPQMNLLIGVVSLIGQKK